MLRGSLKMWTVSKKLKQSHHLGLWGVFKSWDHAVTKPIVIIVSLALQEFAKHGGINQWVTGQKKVMVCIWKMGAWGLEPAQYHIKAVFNKWCLMAIMQIINSNYKWQDKIIFQCGCTNITEAMLMKAKLCQIRHTFLVVDTRKHYQPW